MGHDRHGCEYWLIGCQETYTLGCFNKVGGAPNAATDPVLLIRDTHGHWFKLSAGTMNPTKALVAQFSHHLSQDLPCERGLRNAIVDRLFAVKQRVGSGLHTYKNMQVAEWFAAQATFEKWVQHLHMNTEEILGNANNNPGEVVRLMELVFARCCESRYMLYCASMNRDDIGRFEVNLAYMPHVQTRVKLAKRLRRESENNSQQQRDNLWFKQQAEAADMLLSDDDEEIDGVYRRRETTLEERLRQELTEMISRPLTGRGMSGSRKYAHGR